MSGWIKTLSCFDCGLPYAGEHWVEAVVSPADWLAISPTGNEGGILCINCMASRFAEQGRQAVPVALTAGPFALSGGAEDKAREVLLHHLEATAEPEDIAAAKAGDWRFVELTGEDAMALMITYADMRLDEAAKLARDFEPPYSHSVATAIEALRARGKA